MIDYSLRECPFCGNPAEIVDAEPPEWHSGGKYRKIVCSNEWCLALRNTNNFRFCVEDYCNTYDCAKANWNQRRGRNSNTWKGHMNGMIEVKTRFSGWIETDFEHAKRWIRVMWAGTTMKSTAEKINYINSRVRGVVFKGIENGKLVIEKLEVDERQRD